MTMCFYCCAEIVIFFVNLGKSSEILRRNDERETEKIRIVNFDDRDDI